MPPKKTQRQPKSAADEVNPDQLTYQSIRDKLGFKQDLKVPASSAHSDLKKQDIDALDNWDHSLIDEVTKFGRLGPQEDGICTKEIHQFLAMLQKHLIVPYEDAKDLMRLAHPNSPKLAINESIMTNILQYGDEEGKDFITDMAFAFVQAYIAQIWKAQEFEPIVDLKACVPDFLTRDDARSCCCALASILLVRPASDKDAEVETERQLGIVIANIMCCAAGKGFKFRSNSSAELIYALSRTTKGANPDMCIQAEATGKQTQEPIRGQWDVTPSEESTLAHQAVPDVFTFIAEAKRTPEEFKKAIIQMSIALHPTELVLIIMHCDKHKLSYDARHAKLARYELNELDVTFGVFYGADDLTIVANYPAIAKTTEKGQHQYSWTLRTRVIAKYELAADMAVQRVWIVFVALLTVATHNERLQKKYRHLDVVKKLTDIHRQSEQRPARKNKDRQERH